MARNPQPSPTGDGDEVDDTRENDEGDAQDFDSFRSWLDGLYANAPLQLGQIHPDLQGL